MVEKNISFEGLEDHDPLRLYLEELESQRERGPC